MFGYIQSFCDEVIKTLNATSGLMKGDVGSYKTQVETLKAQAEQLKAKAQDILSHLPIMKTITTTSTDDKGNQVEDEKQVVDDAATSAAQGEAATAQAEAETATQNAISLETLISALLAQLASLASMILGFNNANEAAQAATRNSTNLLVAGASMIGKVISVFNVPEAKNVGDWAKGFGNNVLKTFVGVDLSDGIDTDEVNKIAGIVVDTGATVVSGFTSIVVGSLIASTPIGGTGLASLAVGAVRGGTNLLLNLGRDTAAKVVSKNIVSGLNFLGIKVKEPEKKDGEHEEVELDGESAEAAAAAVSGNQSELGNGEGATVEAQKHSFDELALEILQGKWGNGHQTRQQKLMDAGYITTPEEYQEIRKLVNAKLKDKDTQTTDKGEEPTQPADTDEEPTQTTLGRPVTTVTSRDQYDQNTKEIEDLNKLINNYGLETSLIYDRDELIARRTDLQEVNDQFNERIAKYNENSQELEKLNRELKGLKNSDNYLDIDQIETRIGELTRENEEIASIVGEEAIWGD